MNIPIKLLSNTATLPTKAHNTDACFDIYAYVHSGDIIIEPGECAILGTGITTEIPPGYFAAVFCRSGMGIKRHLRLCNSVGIIDSDYRGEWKVALHNDGSETQVIKHGDRIAQFAILPVLDVSLIAVNELSDTERGTGGFGSTGK